MTGPHPWIGDEAIPLGTQTMWFTHFYGFQRETVISKAYFLGFPPLHVVILGLPSSLFSDRKTDRPTSVPQSPHQETQTCCPQELSSAVFRSRSSMSASWFCLSDLWLSGKSLLAGNNQAISSPPLSVPQVHTEQKHRVSSLSCARETVVSGSSPIAWYCLWQRCMWRKAVCGGDNTPTPGPPTSKARDRRKEGDGGGNSGLSVGFIRGDHVNSSVTGWLKLWAWFGGWFSEWWCVGCSQLLPSCSHC